MRPRYVSPKDTLNINDGCSGKEQATTNEHILFYVEKNMQA